MQADPGCPVETECHDRRDGLTVRWVPVRAPAVHEQLYRYWPKLGVQGHLLSRHTTSMVQLTAKLTASVQSPVGGGHRTSAQPRMAPSRHSQRPHLAANGWPRCAATRTRSVRLLAPQRTRSIHGSVPTLRGSLRCATVWSTLILTPGVVTADILHSFGRAENVEAEALERLMGAIAPPPGPVTRPSSATTGPLGSGAAAGERVGLQWGVGAGPAVVRSWEWTPR